MRIRLRSSSVPVSVLLRDVAKDIGTETVSIRELLDSLGREGLLIFCILMALPFALPISIPGTSIPFGAMIMLIGIGTALNQIPWLPRWLVERRFDAARVRKILIRSSLFFRRIEKMVRPRLRIFVDPPLVHRWNGAMICLAGLLLMAPIPIMGTNTPPAWGVMLLCFGVSQRDGGFVLAGYLATLATIVLFAGLALAAVFAGRGALQFFMGGS